MSRSTLCSQSADSELAIQMISEDHKLYVALQENKEIILFWACFLEFDEWVMWLISGAL